MLAVVSIALGLVLGWLGGGDVRRLTSARLPSEPLLIGLFLIQGLARDPIGSRLGSANVVVWGACSVALLLVCLRAVDVPGLAVIATGIAANGLVVLMNGAMPVVTPSWLLDSAQRAVAASNGFYVLADTRSTAAFLGDVLPAWGYGLASLGDVLLAIGLCAFLVHAMASDATP